jgi:hypothetical protein
MVRVEGKLVWIDTWDYGHPMSEYLRGVGKPVDIKLIIKIQHIFGQESLYKNVRGDIPITPWTMFHSAQMSWLKRQPHFKKIYEGTKKTIDLGFTGRLWNCRKAYFTKMRQMKKAGDNVFAEKILGGSQEDHVRRISTWHGLLCPQGKRAGKPATNGKNRREVECASIGMPIVLNYKPNYINPWEEDVHYLRIRSPDEIPAAIEKLRNHEFARSLGANAFSWWKENASIRGVCQTFIQVCKIHSII